MTNIERPHDAPQEKPAETLATECCDHTTSNREGVDPATGNPTTEQWHHYYFEERSPDNLTFTYWTEDERGGAITGTRSFKRTDMRLPPVFRPVEVARHEYDGKRYVVISAREDFRGVLALDSRDGARRVIQRGDLLVSQKEQLATQDATSGINAIVPGSHDREFFFPRRTDTLTITVDSEQPYQMRQTISVDQATISTANSSCSIEKLPDGRCRLVLSPTLQGTVTLEQGDMRKVITAAAKRAAIAEPQESKPESTPEQKINLRQRIATLKTRQVEYHRRIKALQGKKNLSRQERQALQILTAVIPQNDALLETLEGQLTEIDALRGTRVESAAKPNEQESTPAAAPSEERPVLQPARRRPRLFRRRRNR